MAENELNITDINNPPMPPYRHQSFPRLVYRKPAEGQHPNDAFKVVHNEQEEKKALASGFKSKPFAEKESA